MKDIRPRSEGKEKNILILGGGFGGVNAAVELARRIPEALITLVDRNPYHTYHADLYELAGALFHKQGDDIRKEFLLLRSTTAIPFEEIFAPYPNVKFHQAEVREINLPASEVALSTGRIRYDDVVIALGSETNFFGIPHLGERALELKSTAHALNINAAMEELFSSHGKHEIVSVVIGGGGFTGCELAGELVLSLRRAAKLRGHPEENLAVTLVEASPALLGMAGSWFSARAKKRLEKIGVKVMVKSPIVGVTPTEVVLKEKMSVPYHMLIWTAGVHASSVVHKIKGVEIQKNQCITVNENMHPLPYHNAFVIGDMASCAITPGMVPQLMTAQVAIAEAHYIARHMADKLGGKKDLPDYHPKISRFVVPLGGKYGLADLGWAKVEGVLPWMLKRLVALKYLASILPFQKAWELWRQDTKIFAEND